MAHVAACLIGFEEADVSEAQIIRVACRLSGGDETRMGIYTTLEPALAPDSIARLCSCVSVNTAASTEGDLLVVRIQAGQPFGNHIHVISWVLLATRFLCIRRALLDLLCYLLSLLYHTCTVFFFLKLLEVGCGCLEGLQRVQMAWEPPPHLLILFEKDCPRQSDFIEGPPLIGSRI